MPASAIRKLYPRARKHGNAWWLITAYSPIGDGGYFAPITAKVKDAQVTGFDVWAGGAGEWVPRRAALPAFVTASRRT